MGDQDTAAIAVKMRRESRLFLATSILILFLGRHHVNCFAVTHQQELCSSARRMTRLRASVLADYDAAFDNVKRIFCISDLHTDSSENMAWLEEKCLACSENDGPAKDDVLVVAGDISHNTITLQKTLRLLLSLECHIFFVSGNHEAWLGPQCKKNRTSLDKLSIVDQICNHMGVHTDRALLGVNQEHPLWLVPLQSWYDGSLSIEGCEDLCQDFGRWPWTDFLRCRWPTDRFPLPPKTNSNARIPRGLNDYFLQCNEDSLQPIRKDPTSVLTVSHFLPNSQCLPDWKDLDSPVFRRDDWLDHGAPEVSAKFAKVAGSSALDEQVRSLLDEPFSRRVLHVFGHSHRPKDIEYGNVRYIHNPLGKPREREMRMVSPNVNFQLIWDTRTGEVEGQQIIRYWEEKGGGKEKLWARMKEHRRQRQSLSRRTS